MPRPKKWTQCEMKNGEPHITGPKDAHELTVNKRPRLGQYGVKLKTQSKTRFCKENSSMSFLEKVNSIALKGTAQRKANPKTPMPVNQEETEFVDICKISPELVASFKRGDYAVPKVEVEIAASGGRVLNISDDLVVRVHKDSFTSGAYGSIFKARGPQGPYSQLVVKRNKGFADRKSDFIEVLIQIIMFCDQRAKGKFELSKLATKYKTPAPFIPRLVYYAEAKNTTGSYIVMESMTETLTDFVRHRGTDRAAIISCLKQLCILLKYLQKDFKFMHRDMHGSNIMVKYDASNGKEGRRRARVALIDFGMSQLVAPIEGTGKKKEKLSLGFPSASSSDTFDQKHNYRGKNDFNSSLDLVMLLTFLYHFKEFNSKLPEIRERVLVPVFRKIFNTNDAYYKRIRAKYLMYGGMAPNADGNFDRIGVLFGYLHHIFYEDAVKTEFKECTPTNLLNMLCKLK